MSDTEDILMYGTGWCGDCTRSKAAFRRADQPFVYIDIEEDEKAAALAQEISGAQKIPVIVFPDGDVLVEPSDRELTAKVQSLRSTLH
ncbi:NrdH-redoxin [Microbacteriaceae bacterium VKM Ac-2855]|nr:NrdH-redoxin [Microbacteriaceae bacterium VKM Ac-2855]